MHIYIRFRPYAPIFLAAPWWFSSDFETGVDHSVTVTSHGKTGGGHQTIQVYTRWSFLYQLILVGGK